jgi:hypothetical protein
MDALNDGSESPNRYSQPDQYDEYEHTRSNATAQHTTGDGSHDPSAVPPIDDGGASTGCVIDAPSDRQLSTREHLTLVSDDLPPGTSFLATFRLLNDVGATVGSDRGYIVKTISQAQYEQNFVNIFIILGIALVMAAIGGKLSTGAIWLLSVVLVVFGLSEAVYYSKNGTFFTYNIKPNGASS